MFEVVAPAAPVDARSRFLGATTRLACCTRRDAIAGAVADALDELVTATVIGVRVGGTSAWRTSAGSAALAGHLVGRLSTSDLEPALAGGLVVDLGPAGGVAGALAAGVDAGPEGPPGILLVGGNGIDRDLDGATLVAVADLAAGVLARVDREARHAAQAETDGLTGFLNRLGLERAIADRVPDEGARLGVVDLHLGGITELGAGFGAAAGRRALQAVGERLRSLPLVDAVASVAVDGLTVVVWGDEGAAADQVVAAAARPVAVGRHAVCLDVRAGAAALVTGAPPRDALDRAALARVQAMAEGRAVVVHTDALTAGCHHRLATAARLRRVLDGGGGELVVHYQPQVDRSGRVLGLEALVRWAAEDGTFVRPDDFLPVAEQAGLMAEIDLHVLRSSCRQLAAWAADGLIGFRLAVNLSASTLARPEIGAAILAVLDETGIDPARLELEITETAASDESGWVAVLERLRQLGVSVAMDDFGTGYSSLGRIHRLPLDRLKVDRSFVADLGGAGATVVAAVVALAAGLGLRVLAEGVEDDDQLAALVALGCDEFQGYGFARPVNAEDATAVLVQGGCR
jgi:EAL domain-containing protein (putative c-di-GMP-specific phosphodiesterase class I)/GGDEF domain-containing protein